MLPNIAVINELRSKNHESRIIKSDSGIDVFYIGEKNGVEEKITKEEGIAFYGIHTGKLRRYFSLQNIIDVLKVPVGVVESFRILKRLKPDLVFSKGGYVSVPVVLAARLLKIPIWLHESDSTPGLSTKIASRFAQKIWLSFEESRPFFAKYKNVGVVGNPIRSEILKGDKAEGYKLTGFSSHKPVVLIMGGSSGARSLNKVVLEALPKLLKEVQVVHVTGENSVMSLRGAGATKQSHYRNFSFLNKELPDVYAIADVIVTRAGSGSIFEGLALGKPLLLVPLPKWASRGDQIENAEIFARHGWAQVLRQESLTPKKLQATILELLNKKLVRHKTSHTYLNAAARIADEILIFGPIL